MKNMIQMIGCLVIVLFLSSNTMTATGKPGEEKQAIGKVKGSGWIGISIQDVNEKTAKKLKLDGEEGAYVREVIDDSPADSAGIRKGDVIVEFHERKVFDADDLVKAVRRTDPGTKADIILIRDGKKLTVHMTIGKNKEMSHRMIGPRPNIQMFAGNRIYGMQLLTLNEQLGEYFGAPNNEGVLVEEVEHKSTADKAGFKAGDVIIQVGKKPVSEVEKVQRELRKYDEGEKVDFEVLRKGVKKTLAIEIEEEESLPHRFFFRGQRWNGFSSDPLFNEFFNNGPQQLDIEEMHSNLNRAQKELQESLQSIDRIPQERETSLKRSVVSVQEYRSL